MLMIALLLPSHTWLTLRVFADTYAIAFIMLTRHAAAYKMPLRYAMLRRLLPYATLMMLD